MEVMPHRCSVDAASSSGARRVSGSGERNSISFPGSTTVGDFGSLLGLLAGYNPVARAIIMPYVDFLRPIPPIALVTLFVLFLGIGLAGASGLFSALLLYCKSHGLWGETVPLEVSARWAARTTRCPTTALAGA